MLRQDSINVKAFHELILYFLRERITAKNLEIKYLIATNIHEWFIFDANIFEKTFAQNKNLVKQFNDFEAGRLAGKTTDFFYKEIAEPFVSELKQEIEFTFFDLWDYDKPLRSDSKKDDNKLIALFKLLSPEHLLKLPFINDSNSLDKKFYTELLHIIGLIETKEGSKKLIGRKEESHRNTGSLLENAIIQLDDLDKLSRLEKPSQYGETQQDRLFGVGLELCITWVNRVLFLKLLEAQLITYHKSDKAYSFLNYGKINNYDDLNSLFFQVLARQHENRNEDVQRDFAYVPYLNSSLFEPTELEHNTLFISNLRDGKKIPILSSTVLKSDVGKKRTGELNALQYLFEFLEAYDFSSEGSEDIQEENKTLINASVLGLIFEKINGYKDGSFFTPGFITMYMCRETIRRAVVQKFNERKAWNCKDFDELYDKIEDRKEANDIINSLKICDPAVGSGHFLVSALNEILAVKNELKILQDREGKRLKEYQAEVVNDELIVTDDDGELFDYHYTNKESQRVQEALFHEKQTIIENCLFGVDINPNSVKICRLRLWIELLKNAYYKNETELETLPNIDINIKCGNSLISRFDLDSDLKLALKKSKWTIESYRLAVDTYRNAQSKEEKREMEHLIADIKSDFRSEISKNDPKLKRLYKFKGELTILTTQKGLFEMSSKEKKVWNKKVETLTKDTKKLETDIEGIKNNKIYENAFEWRFEFPEVLNENGDFSGFDVVIGNPPYMSSKGFSKEILNFLKHHFSTAEYQFDLYVAFLEMAVRILSNKSHLSYITPNSWLKNIMVSKCRQFLLENLKFNTFFANLDNIFEEASVDTLIFNAQKIDILDEGEIQIMKFYNEKPITIHKIRQERFNKNPNHVFDIETSEDAHKILIKIRDTSVNLEKISEITRGVNPYDKYRGQSAEVIKNKAYHSDSKKDETFLPEIRGKHINTYSYQWDGRHWISYGDWLAAPRDKKFFEGERIVMRQVLGERLNTTLIMEDFIIDQSVFIAKLIDEFKSYSYSILGQLNSKLIAFYFKYSSNEFDALFPKIKIGEFKQLPICKDFLKSENILTNKVNHILSLRSENPKAEIFELEKEIDQLVYALYSLTEEEIRIVEEV